MVFRAFVLYAFVSHMTLANAASFARFFVRDATDSPTTDFRKQNGLAAQQLNAQFTSLTASDSCKDGSLACVNDAFAQCTGGKWALTQCPTGLSCFALPLVNSPGTSIACDTEQDALARINASGASGGLTGTSGNSTSVTPSTSSSGIATSSIPASVTGINTPSSTPTAGTTGGHTSQHGNGSSEDDCGDDGKGSIASSGDLGDTGADDCNDDNNTSSHHHQGGNSTNSTDSSDDCNDDDSSSHHQSGGSTETSGDGCDGEDGTGGTENHENDGDCDDGVTSSAPEGTPTASASHASSSGSDQVYRRQLNFITAAGETTLVVPTQTAQPTTASNSSPLYSSPTVVTRSSSVPLAPTTLSSNTGTNTHPGASTVTLTLVSTITVTASECQTDSTGLPSNSATLSTSGFSTTFLSPFPSASNSQAPPNTFTSIPTSFTPSASGRLSNTFTTPTASSSAPQGTGGIVFTQRDRV